MSKRNTLLVSAFLLGIMTFGSQTSFGASIQDEALAIAKANASTGMLTSTGYKPLKDVSEKLKEVEGENGPTAKQVLGILTPTLLVLASQVPDSGFSNPFVYANIALDTSALFEDESGTVKAQLMEQIMLWTKKFALETATKNASTGFLTSTGYIDLKPIAEELIRLEGENGPIAQQMVETLVPGLLVVAKNPQALKIAALFGGEDGPLALRVKEAAAQP